MRLFLFLLLFSPITLNAQDTLRVLFLGNSYTGVNNLPQLVSDLATSAGDHIIFGSNTPGGYTLNGHSTNATSLQLIAQGDWDFVVLQEQSQIPSFPLSQVSTECFPYATTLDSLIRDANACSETVFYNTWGRENGDAGNCAGWPPVCTYEGMDDLLRQRYDQMATDNNGIVSPVGPLWRFIRTSSPGLQLYSADESHPSLAGSYAAACSFYSTLFRKDPTFITADAGLSGPDALTIRNSAKVVVFDSLATWHVGEYDTTSPCATTGIENHELHQLIIHPNPVKDVVILYLKQVSSSHLVNAQGIEMELFPRKVNEGIQIDLSSFSSGIYWLKIESEGKLYQAKVVKE